MRRAVRAAAVVAIGAIALVGCSDDGGDAADTTTTEAVAADAGDATEATASATDGDFSVTLTFWRSSELDLSTDEPPLPDRDELPPAIDLDLYWDDAADCFIWDRTVAESIGGGIRRNTASDFVIGEEDGVTVFTYTQNAGKCDEEFEGQAGTVKTFRSDYLVVDETTGQTGDALWVGVTDVQTPD